MDLPSEFISIITNTFGEDGEQLIAHLPVLIDEASQQWGLTNIQPVPNLSYNFVAFATLPSPPTPLPLALSGAVAETKRGEGLLY
jgi:hypothetical protein